MRSPSCDDHFNSEDRQNSVECEGVGSVISDGFVQWDTYTNHAHYTITDSTMFKVSVGYWLCSYWLLLMSWCLMSAVRCFVYLLLIFFSFLINKSFYCLLAIRFTKIQKEVRRADIRSTSQNSRRHNHTIYFTKYNYRFSCHVLQVMAITTFWVFETMKPWMIVIMLHLVVSFSILSWLQSIESPSGHTPCPVWC